MLDAFYKGINIKILFTFYSSAFFSVDFDRTPSIFLEE